MDNQYNSKALKKYNSNKIKLNSLIKTTNKPELIQPNNIQENQENQTNQENSKTNDFLLNGKCRVCNLEDRTCRCLRFSKTSIPKICYCGNKDCEFDCGVLACGCIDMCRRHRDYNDY